MYPGKVSNPMNTKSNQSSGLFNANFGWKIYNNFIIITKKNINSSHLLPFLPCKGPTSFFTIKNLTKSSEKIAGYLKSLTNSFSLPNKFYLFVNSFGLTSSCNYTGPRQIEFWLMIRNYHQNLNITKVQNWEPCVFKYSQILTKHSVK